MLSPFLNDFAMTLQKKNVFLFIFSYSMQWSASVYKYKNHVVFL